METLVIPAGGLKLARPFAGSDNGSHDTKAKPVQVMRLDFSPDVLQEVLKAAGSNGKGLNVSFGKAITFHYGNKSQQLQAMAQPSRSELYAGGHSTDLAFAGVLSHKLAMKQAQDTLAGTDAALAKLQSQMASHQKDKQSKQIHFVRDGSNLPPPVQQKQATAKSNPVSMMKKYQGRARVNNTATRSMPTSPSIAAAHSPSNHATPPTSVPVVHDEKVQKLQALRIPILHLLAVRQVSEKYLSQKVCCTQPECLEVLRKVAQPYHLDPSKWELSSRSFKELDVWKFPYPSEDDRQLAINQSVSAFDRMRLSREDKLWQLLLPVPDRGQGKVISKLNLHAGPIQKSNTPRINVQPSNDLNQGGQETANDNDRRDRLAPSDAEPMVRSRSNDPIKKTKVSAREEQTRRLLSKNPKKLLQASKSREAPKAKETPKAKEAQSSERKGPKKAKPSVTTTAKSTEFVHESDEDDQMEDIDTRPASSLPAKPVVTVEKAPSTAAATVPSTASLKLNNPVVKDSKAHKAASTLTGAVVRKSSPPSPSSSRSRNGVSDASQSSLPMSKSLSRQRNTSSPHKPSPLGSSPPTNASDLDADALSYHASSTSSTPLPGNPCAANATALAPNDQPPIKAAHNTSEHHLKRKANDIGSGIHDHVAPTTMGRVNSAKRHKASILSPPTSDSSDSTSPAKAQSDLLTKARHFQELYARYEKLYHEVLGWKGAPEDQVESVHEMHERLKTLKDEIIQDTMAFQVAG